MILMSLGEADIDIYIIGDNIPINYETGEQHPFFAVSMYDNWKSGLSIACPLPQKVSSFHNIVTPLDLYSWIAVLVSTVVVSMGFIVDNWAYRRLSDVPCNSWKW